MKYHYDKWNKLLPNTTIQSHINRWLKLSTLLGNRNIDTDGKIDSTLHIENEIIKKQREIQQLQNDIKQHTEIKRSIYNNEIEKMRLEGKLIPYLETLNKSQLEELGGLVDIHREIHYIMETQQKTQRQNRQTLKSYL